MRHKFPLPFFLLPLFFFCASIINASAAEITADNRNHSLIAPEGCSYKWFYNNEAVEEENGQAIKVSKSGMYAVEVTDEAGLTEKSEALIMVDAAGAIIKIYLIGDSTVCNYSASDYPMTGWGQMLPYFFGTGVQTDNRAIGGRSSRSFYNQGRWTTVKNLLATGDYVFIQFGHNDRNYNDTTRYTSVEDYKKYLTIYCNDARAKGAIPVMVSPMVMNAWNGTTMRNVFTESGNNYRGAMLEVATKLNVAFVDLNMKSWNLYKSLGKDYISRFVYHTYVAGEYPNYPNGITDGTHFQEMGAIENARMVVQGISELSARSDMQALIQNLKPQFEISVKADPAASALLTSRTASYPQGLTVTLKTLPAASGKFQKWTNASGSTVSTATLTTVKSGSAATSYTAVYAGAATCSATITAPAQIICKGETLTLTANSGTSYSWKKNGTIAGTAQTLKVTETGSYVLEVTTGTCKAVSDPFVLTLSEPETWYKDTDGDGKGDEASAVVACIKPTGYVADKTDKCPTDAAKSEPGSCGCGNTEQSCRDCSGVANGSAFKDSCTRCVGGTTGKTACSSSLQAETAACLYDGITEAINPGFRGTSYINTTNEEGASVSFRVNTEKTGNAVIGFRYACGSANNRLATISINGTTIPGTVSFPPTGAYSTWSTTEVSVPLTAGNNLIELTANTSEGLANIDEILFISSGISQGSCIVITGSERPEAVLGVAVFPNPFDENFSISASGEFSFTLCSSDGREIMRGKGEHSKELKTDLPAGIYQLKVESAGKTDVFKVIRK